MQVFRFVMVYFLLLASLLLPGRLADATDTADVRVAAQDALAAQFPESAHRLVARVVRTSGDVEGRPALRVDFPAEAGLPRGHTKARLLAGNEAGTWREVGWALLYVAHYDSVVIAHQSVRQGEPVDPDDLSAAWLETTRIPGRALHPDEVRTLAAQGTIFAARPLREGRMVDRGDLRPAYAADTGGALTVLYRRKGIVLRLPCKAREPGFVGDEIRVYSSDTRATYRARITAPGLAEWIETL